MNDFTRQELTSESVPESLTVSANQLVAHAEQLMHETASLSQEGIAVLRQKLASSLSDVRSRIKDAQAYAMKRGREAATGTDAYVREKPWQAIGVAAALGMLGGLLLTPSRR